LAALKKAGQQPGEFLTRHVNREWWLSGIAFGKRFSGQDGRSVRSMSLCLTGPSLHSGLAAPPTASQAFAPGGASEDKVFEYDLKRAWSTSNSTAFAWLDSPVKVQACHRFWVGGCRGPRYTTSGLLHRPDWFPRLQWQPPRCWSC
jgi:hypothetical protein